MTTTLNEIKTTTHGKLWACLDALELGETWLIKEKPAGVRMSSLMSNYNFQRKKSRGRRMGYHIIETGILFVRVK